MLIRIDIQDERVEDILNKIDRNKRRYFIEEAILHYEQYLRVDKRATSVFLQVEKEKSIFDVD